MKQLIKYIGVGTINTLVTGISILILMSFSNIGLFGSNCIGYILGLLCSYILNRNYVFKSKSSQRSKEFIRFIIVFIIAYSINILFLYLFSNILNIGRYTSQYLSMIVYSLSFFYLCKFYTFKNIS